ncbi:MAG: HAMP domain-containing histidine kinase [Anaerolineae bacterium]|nr:HAMP domain-containing histidine kinase [Anaerolineae bacterium]
MNLLSNRALSPIFVLIFAMLAAFGIAMAMIVLTLNPPLEDIQQLMLFMISTGAVTIGGVYLLYRRRLIQWFTSLRWTLLTIIILTVVLVFINVFVTAQLMFISEHDLLLTSALLVYGGVIAVISVIFIAGTLIERIELLGNAARRVARGELHTRLSVRGNDELAHLTRMFNNMAEELETVDAQKRALDQTRRDLVAWASHDLRSPLAAVRAMNEAILDGVVDDEVTILRYRQQMQREIEHLGRLIDDLFELAQMDTGHLALERKPTNLRPLIDEALESLAARAAEAQIMLSSTVPADLPTMRLAADKIERVLYNLLDNGLRHTPQGGSIYVDIEKRSEIVLIRVRNTGSTISPEDLPHIFDRFYRGENARTPHRDGQRGAGLGLAITRGFVEAHDGRISVESDAVRGTTFTVALPL